jgi:hypothetical protein
LLKVKLLLVINALAGETNAIVTASDAKMDEILKLLRRRTNAEADLSNYIDSRGGIQTIVRDDKLMRRLVNHVEGQLDSDSVADESDDVPSIRGNRARLAQYSSAARYGSTSRNPNYYSSNGGQAGFSSYAWGGGRSRRPTKAQGLSGDYYGYEEPGEGDGSLTVQLYKEQIQSALSTDLSVVLRRNEQRWTFKLDYFSGNIMRHFDIGTDRMIKLLIDADGPHTGIEHPELRAIWGREVRGVFGLQRPVHPDCMIS